MPATPAILAFEDRKTDVYIKVQSGADTAYIEFDRSWVNGTGSQDDSQYVGTSGVIVERTFAKPTTPGQYYLYVRGRTGSTASSWISRGVYVEPDPFPSVPSISVYSTSGNTVTFRITTGNNTGWVDFNYSWQYYTIDETVYTSSNTTFYHTVTVPSYGSYSVQVRAGNNGYYSGWGASLGFTTSNSPPSISITNGDGKGSIKVSWTASDSDGLRSGDRYQVYISDTSGSTSSLRSKGYTNESSFTFTTDANNSPLVDGVAYRIRVAAYDVYNLSSYADRYVTYTNVRPPAFQWTYTKTAGVANNLTYNEWKSFLDNINTIRSYKGLVQRNFNTATSKPVGGNDVIVPSAESFNAAINAINDMNPSTSPAAPVVRGERITSAKLNRMRDSLNSVA